MKDKAEKRQQEKQGTDNADNFTKQYYFFLLCCIFFKVRTFYDINQSHYCITLTVKLNRNVFLFLWVSIVTQEAHVNWSQCDCAALILNCLVWAQITKQVSFGIDCCVQSAFQCLSHSLENIWMNGHTHGHTSRSTHFIFSFSFLIALD